MSILTRPLFAILCIAALFASAASAQAPPSKERLLWQKLEAAVHQEDEHLDGVLGVEILDLTNGSNFSLHADEVFPTASSIKIAILAELYRQVQQGKLKLSDSYTVQTSDLVGGSGISQALTPGATRLTLRDVAVLMVSVSDNSMTNVLIDRVGMENVDALLDSLGLSHTRLRRKMMDVKAASEGRENVSTPHEMALLLKALYDKKALNQELTDDFFKVLSVPKSSYIPRYLPEDLRIANKPGELEGVRNDCGLVFTGKRPYIISVMTSYLRRERDAGDAISRISEAAWRMFDRLDRSSDLGRIVSIHDSSPP